MYTEVFVETKQGCGFFFLIPESILKGTQLLLSGWVGMMMKVLKRHIKVGVYMMHSGNWGQHAFSVAFPPQGRAGDEAGEVHWSLEPVLGPTALSRPSVFGQDCSFHPLNNNQMKIIRQQKIKTWEFLLPFIPRSWQWLYRFLKIRLIWRNCSCLKRVDDFIDAIVNLKLLLSALVAEN